MTIRFPGAALFAAFLPALFAGAAHAVPISFTTTGSSLQTYFESNPAVSGSARFGGVSAMVDLTPDTGQLAKFFDMFAGTGPADPGQTGIEYKTHSISMTVQGVTHALEIDIGMQEIGNDQYQLHGFDLPTLTFDLGATGMLTVTPDTRYTQSVQFLANTPNYGFRNLYATFLLTDPQVSQAPEPGSLALAMTAAGAFWVTRRRRTLRRPA